MLMNLLTVMCSIIKVLVLQYINLRNSGFFTVVKNYLLRHKQLHTYTLLVHKHYNFKKIIQLRQDCFRFVFLLTVYISLAS